MRHTKRDLPHEEIYKVLARVAHTALRYASHSAVVLAAVSSAASTVGYVVYKDYTRYRVMIDTFATGNMVEPFKNSNHEVTYFSRPKVERHLRDIIRPEISNQYYFVFGEVGVGKTRLITEVVRSAICQYGTRGLGAPIYVMTTQGNSFADTFALAVNYYFDEHINFKSFLDILLRIGEVPKLDEQSKLDRVLNAVERAAYAYLERTNKPVVIVIDGIQWLTETQSGALERLQEKAKLWADLNIAKVIFVSNDEKTEEIFQQNHSAWSRGAITHFIGDLTQDEARTFLKLPCSVLERAAGLRKGSTSIDVHPPRFLDDMSKEYVDKVIDLVGGRLQLLLVCKQAWMEGKKFEETAHHLKLKERVKFWDVSSDESLTEVIHVLRGTPGRRLPRSKLAQMTSQDAVVSLAKKNVIKIERDSKENRLMVEFQSRLTEVVIDELIERGDFAVLSKKKK